MVFWMTGLSGAGKSTLSEAVYALLSQKGYAVAVIDGDRLRSGLCSDLGFQEADRAKTIVGPLKWQKCWLNNK